MGRSVAHRLMQASNLSRIQCSRCCARRRPCARLVLNCKQLLSSCARLFVAWEASVVVIFFLLVIF